MASPIEIVVPVVEAAVALVPALLEVPILGRILITLLPHGGGDTQALAELQKVADKKKLDRKTRIQNNARYVIKASEAMECVQKHLMSGEILLALGKGIANGITGSGDGSAPDILCEAIFKCIEENVLRQTTPRSQPRAERRGKYGRPAKGHGKGRGKFE